MIEFELQFLIHEFSSRIKVFFKIVQQVVIGTSISLVGSYAISERLECITFINVIEYRCLSRSKSCDIYRCFGVLPKQGFRTFPFTGILRELLINIGILLGILVHDGQEEVLVQERTICLGSTGLGIIHTGSNADDLKHTLKNFVNASPVEIVVGEIPNSNLGAFYNFETQQITLNENLTDTKQIFECLAQEVAFAQLADGKKSYSRRDEGFKAVCLAYMICTKYGVDKNAFAIESLPDNWKKADVKDIRRELSSVNSAYKEIVSRVNDEIYRQRQAKSKEMER